MPDLRPHPVRRLQRLLVTVVLLLGAGAAGCGDSGAEEAPAPPTAGSETTATSAAPTGASMRAARERALRVLSEWDARRSAALVSDDTNALRGLYVDDSPLAAQDVRMLRRYRERGVRLTSVTPQVISVRVRVSSLRVVEVVVVDRLAAAHARTGQPGAEPRPLPVTRYARRELRFVRADEGWRLSSARAA